jgi:hypothetical protein
MAEAGFAKLLWLEAKKTRDPDGADEILVSRLDGGIFERIRMHKDDVFTFDDRLRLLPFPQNQAPVVVVLTEVDEGSDRWTRIGSASISAEELGSGETVQRIEGAGALYLLTYKVI